MPEDPRHCSQFIDKQNPGGIAILGAILCAVLAIGPAVSTFQTGTLSAELVLLVALTLIFLAAWRLARRL